MLTRTRLLLTSVPLQTPQSLSLAKICPLRGGLARHLQEGPHWFSCSCAGCQARGQTLSTGHSTSPDLCCPVSPQTTQPSSGGPGNTQLLQHEVWEQMHPKQLRRAGPRRQGWEGFSGPRWVPEERPFYIPFSLGACYSGSRWALAHGWRKSPHG